MGYSVVPRCYINMNIGNNKMGGVIVKPMSDESVFVNNKTVEDGAGAMIDNDQFHSDCGKTLAINGVQSTAVSYFRRNCLILTIGECPFI